MKQYWDKAWDKYADSVSSYTDSFAEACLAFLKEERKAQGALLDLGCGIGRASSMFADASFDVTAFDLSSRGLALIGERDERISCIQGDMTALPFSSASFDVVYASLSLHYFNNDTTVAIFAKIQDMLSPEGVLFIKCKSVQDALYGKGEEVGPDMFKDERGKIRHFFSPEYLCELLKNFSIIRVWEDSSDEFMDYEASYVYAIAKKV